ncbi:ATP-binding cassette domain-containing protein [Saccharibacillus alkalitolerans]|uniref:ATP-binding cassette domain-containing protein n=1 Tax=Saccharibacillus alkalitolerans TaxID=2705290 RepID=A0ABX0F8V0_9BACL|nr:ATP-binding cassette domain-containing protein [Saccharibacillus alkalitolerans]NGZ77392.1 ATP-binding cassette domain-containing protein [Saccharibacillus alkalitolerans]
MERKNAAAAELQNVEFEYEKGEPVLRDISLRAEKGEWIAVVGESGCGKSTLVRLLNALLRPRSGTVSVFGEELTERNAPLMRARIGMVFQNPDNQFIGETVEEDIAFGLEGLCLDLAEMERRIERYAHRLKIEALLGRHPGELSGGQKQRCAVAACLAMEPEIVVFDEATSMQDERSRRELLEVMRDMKRQGSYTVFSVTHDAAEMLAADRIWALKGGFVRADRTPDAFFADEELLGDCGIELPFGLRLERRLSALGAAASDGGAAETGAKQAGEGGYGRVRHRQT